MNTRFSVRIPRNKSGHAVNGSPVNSSGLSALTHSRDVLIHSLDGGRCIIAGDCFPELTATYSGPRDLAQMVQFLARSHWGRFLIVAHDPSIATAVIYRDPSGMFPCYYSLGRDCVAISTDCPSILTGDKARPHIDWDELSHCLLKPHLRRHKTCLGGVFEVLPGEMVIIDENGPRHELIWRPSRYLGRSRAWNFADAQECLKQSLLDTLGLWGRRYPNPLVSVSGGFDSSTLAALLCRSASAELIHFYIESPRGDERQYATTLAQYLGRSIEAILCQADDIEIQRNLSSCRPRPSARSFTQSFDKASAKYAGLKGASAHFNGGGGDNVFGKLHSAYPLIDRYRHEGLSGALVETALDICHVTGASIPAVLRQTAGLVLKGTNPASWYSQSDFLTKRALSSVVSDVHVWLADASEASPGERQLVRNIARATALTDHLNITDTLPTIYPFLSQPIMEQCLSFPTWFWMTGGRDRALARAAMHEFLPEQILHRTGKGAFDGLAREILRENWDVIFVDLEQGVLAEHGLIDVTAIRKYRSEKNESISTSNILYIHEAETWCRSWC